ncbi:MAG: hypothetical protein FJ399_13655 [Verrucomicrobia bacterium]|nr:hypothetical protein [Verrucomicrobiota bacterium]
MDAEFELQLLTLGRHRLLLPWRDHPFSPPSTPSPAPGSPSVSCWRPAWARRPPPRASTGQPNVVFIVSDDQGYGELGVQPHRGPPPPTPNLDRLGRPAKAKQR